jgi:hypothetical protein
MSCWPPTRCERFPSSTWTAWNQPGLLFSATWETLVGIAGRNGRKA